MVGLHLHIGQVAFCFNHSVRHQLQNEWLHGKILYGSCNENLQTAQVISSNNLQVFILALVLMVLILVRNNFRMCFVTFVVLWGLRLLEGDLVLPELWLVFVGVDFDWLSRALLATDILLEDDVLDAFVVDIGNTNPPVLEVRFVICPLLLELHRLPLMLLRWCWLLFTDVGFILRARCICLYFLMFSFVASLNDCRATGAQPNKIWK